MENPFEFGRELGIEELVDRQTEVDEVVRTIEGGAKLFLIGPRRYGKTSILKAAEDKLIRRGAVVLRYNAESYPTIDLMVTALVADAAKSLKGGVERAAEQIRSFFGRLRPEVTFNLTDLEWSAKLGISNEEKAADHISLLVEALEGLERLAEAQSADRPVGLVIDEFQKVTETSGQDAEAQLRAAIQRHRRTGYVFAGSKTRLLTAMTLDAARPFYRLGSLRFIGPIPRPDFSQFLHRKFTESGFVVDPADGSSSNAIDHILNSAEEVPYNVQLLAHTCWDYLRSLPASENRQLTGEIVQTSLERIVRQYDPFYTQLWNDLTAIQQKTLLAVIAEDGTNMQSMKVARIVGRGPSTVRRALDALMSRDVLREDESLGGVRMRFEDPFFAHWMRLFAPRL
jgi:AAA+ ATPase superfamily predicted ATPase